MIVLDCSALAEISLGTTEGKALRGLMLENERVVAPELLHAEFASVMRKLALRGQTEKGLASQRTNKALKIVNEFYPLQPLRTEAINESIRLQHSVYDMFYFVLARRMGATLFTTDRKLMRLCAEHGVDVVEEVEF